jgi:hypothetical protein
MYFQFSHALFPLKIHHNLFDHHDLFGLLYMVFGFEYVEDMLNLQQCMASLFLFGFLEYVLLFIPFVPSFYKMLIDVHVLHHEFYLVH